MTDASAPLTKQLYATQEELLTAIATPAFYLEWLYIGIAISVAWLAAVLIRRRVNAYLALHPPKRIDAIFITKPLKLLAPLLALPYLSLANSLIKSSDGGTWTDAIIRLTIAYLAARVVMLIIRSRAVGIFIAIVIMAIAVLDVTGFMKSTTTYLDSIAFETGKFKLSLLNFIHGNIILVIVFWMAAISSSTLESYLRRSSSMSYSARELIVKFFKLFVYFVALLITFSALGVDLTAFAVFGGALGVGIGLGLQKITANFVSGIILLMEKSIKLDDLIEVGGTLGWVRQLNVRYTLVETLDGRAILIPNDELLSSRVTSWTYTDAQARIEILAKIAYGSDAKRAQSLMLDAARTHPRCLRTPEPTCFLQEFADLGMVLSLTFWIPDIKEGRAHPRSDIMLAILEKFREAGIELAFVPRGVSENTN